MRLLGKWGAPNTPFNISFFAYNTHYRSRGVNLSIQYGGEWVHIPEVDWSGCKVSNQAILGVQVVLDFQQKGYTLTTG